MRDYLGILLLLAAATAAAAGTPPARPDCTQDNLGRFWPDEANENPSFARALMPYGYPEVCTRAGSRYEWRSMTVSVNQLRRDARRKRSVPAPSGGAGKQTSTRATGR